MAKHWWTRAVVGRTSVSDPLQDREPPDARFEAEWRLNVRARLLIMLGVLAVCAVGVEAQLVYLQVYSHEEYAATALRQQREKIRPEAPRGDILDRNGSVFAYTVPSIEVLADPGLFRSKDPVEAAKLEKPADVARGLCEALGDCAAAELGQITKNLQRQARRVIIRPAKAMSATAILGLQTWLDARSKLKSKTARVIFAEPRYLRYYPKMDLAGHAVGFVGADGKGGGGIESRYDTEIRGVPGTAYAYVDGKTNEMFTVVDSEPVRGATIELTLDVNIQNFAEQALKEGVLASGAAGGTVIVLRSETGEILTHASWPPYNPNVYWKSSEEARTDRIVHQTLEPGSTMKILTASAALNEGVLKPSDLIDTRPGILRLSGRTITEDKGHNYGVLSVSDVLIRSSNVGAVQMAWRVGKDPMLRYLAAFGLGQRLSPDFRNESVGGVGFARTLNDSGLASVAMGYQTIVTPLQMVSAINVIATGGLLMEPRIVRAFVRDGQRDEIQPKVLRRVITPETALTMTTMMEGVVSDDIGTGSLAALDRYQVAGKTGTAAKVVDRRYSKSDYNVSFGAFVPSRRPIFTIFVVVDTPRQGPKYGGRVAAPIFKKIAEYALQYSGIPASINPTPPIVVPTERSILPVEPTRVSTVEATSTSPDGHPVMPDLRGLTLREALRVANALELNMSYVGDGVVTAQTPVPGAAIQPSDRGVLELRRTPVKPGGGDR